jgi:ABC-type phosphate transport system substrate-binding protein
MRLLLLSLPLLWMILPEPLRAEEMVAVIVPAASLLTDAPSREELASIYGRKKLFWENGARIIPVNLPAAHPLRRSFSRLVLGAPPEAMAAYWNAQYFHGIAPPYVLASEEAVLQFVATTPGAIGYVSASAVNRQVRVLLTLPLPPVEKQP